MEYYLHTKFPELYNQYKNRPLHLRRTTFQTYLRVHDVVAYATATKEFNQQEAEKFADKVYQEEQTVKLYEQLKYQTIKWGLAIPHQVTDSFLEICDNVVEMFKERDDVTVSYAILKLINRHDYIERVNSVAFYKGDLDDAEESEDDDRLDYGEYTIFETQVWGRENKHKFT